MARGPRNDRTASCAFDKWSIGISGDLSTVLVQFGRHPNSGQLELSDLSVEDVERLADLFTWAKLELTKEK
jgi:hypothetical protein